MTDILAIHRNKNRSISEIHPYHFQDNERYMTNYELQSDNNNNNRANNVRFKAFFAKHYYCYTGE